jgi:sigma-B regulation protein RsbU (phosphoserine phosphatase)
LTSPAPAGPRLEWSETPDRRQAFPLGASEIVIGRRADADIVLTHPLVSRHHARIVRESEAFVVVDLNSSHGTFVNGSRVSRQPLRPRDRIRLGEQGVELIFMREDSRAHNPDPDTTTVASLLEEVNVERAARRLATVLPDESATAHSELEKISCLLDFHYYFGKTFSAEKTFNHILKSALTISGAERAFILKKDRGAFTFAGGMNGLGNPLGQSDFRTSGTVVDRILRDGQPVFMTQGIHGEFAGSESIVAMNLRAVACLPLEAISNESETPGIVGILYLDSRKHMHSLSGLDEKLLTRLAHEAGHVMEKLEMVVALTEKRRIEQELAIAEETQRSLLPRTLPEYAPFRIRAFSRPTRQLGGDFYDFIAVQNGLLTGVLADVSGKGIPAALLSSFTLGTLNMEFRSRTDPAGVLGSVNSMLIEKTPSHRFVTLFLFQLGPDGEGHYINAGHNPPYVFRAATGEVEELLFGGMPLGMFGFASYETSPLQLGPGDVLLIYTDGLTEAENSAQEQFGDERLRDLIRSEAPRGAAALESQMLAALDAFTQDAMQTDDITFLLIENHGA